MRKRTVMRQLRLLGIALALAGAAALFSACDSLFGEYTNPLDHYAAETVWYRPAASVAGYGYDLRSDGFYPTQGSLLQIAANPAAVSPDADDALYMAYSVESGGTFGPARFETKTQSFTGPNAYVRDLVVDADGNAYMVGFDLADDQQKIYAVDFTGESFTLINTVPRDMPWRVIPPDGGATISPDGLEITISLPPEFAIYRYSMSAPGDTGGDWTVAAGTPGDQGGTTNGNGGAATDALLGGPFDLATAPDGSLFFVDTLIEILDQSNGNYSRSEETLRSIDPEGTLSGISPFNELVGVTLPDVPSYINGYVFEAPLAVDATGNIYARYFSGLIRIEADSLVATQIGGNDTQAPDYNEPLADWSADTGPLAEFAREADLRHINDISVAENGDVFVSQGGFGLLQGLRIVRLY